MRYRAFGRTGVQVSRLCLGAMMFGQWGNPDHDESIAVIHAALDAGIKTAATIQPVEMQHAAILHFLLGEYPVPDAFAKSAGARPVSDQIG